MAAGAHPPELADLSIRPSETDPLPGVGTGRRSELSLERGGKDLARLLVNR